MVRGERLDHTGRKAHRRGAVKTFIIDWPVLLFIGFVFGAFAPRARWFGSRPFVAGAVSAVAFTLVAFISYAIAPDWMWMYFIDPSDAVWALPAIFVGYLFFYVLGFAAAIAMSEIGRGLVWGAAALCALLEVVVVALTWDRYHLIGSRSEWLNGTADELLTASPAGDAKTIGFLAPVFIVVTAIALFLTIRQRRASPAGR